LNKRKFKEALDHLLEEDVEGISWDQKLSLVTQRIVKREKKLNLNAENKGKPWTDEELRLVLRTAPTVENCMLLARTFRRGYGSIEQIFRWAASRSLIAKKRPDHSFVNQIKRIAEEVGWRAT
jgi:hypothetical protein